MSIKYYIYIYIYIYILFIIVLLKLIGFVYNKFINSSNDLYNWLLK